MRACLETELSRELVDAEVPIMSLALQHTKGDQAAGEVMPLGSLGARLTATQCEVLFAHTDDFFDVGPDVIPPAYLRGRDRQAIGGVILGAVSDHQYCESPTQPTGLGPIGMPAMGTEPVPLDAAVLLEATHNIPAIVPTPLQEPRGRGPGVRQRTRGATGQAIASLAQRLQGQLDLRGATWPPQAHTQREA